METPNAQPNPDASIADLRAMLTGGATDTTTKEPAKETPAAAAETTPPASEPAGKAAQGKESEPARGDDGKFKAAKENAGENANADLPEGVQKRINKAVKAQRDAERRVQELESQIQGNKPGSQPATEKAPPAETQTQAPKEPKEEDFATFAEYNRALARYEADKLYTERDTKNRQTTEASQRATAQQQRQADFDASEIEARKTHADYDDVVSSIEWPAKSPAMGPIADYLLDTKNAALMYALGKQPDELKRIAGLPPIQAIAALGKFEAALTAAAPTTQTTPAKPAGKALPKPPTNAGGSGSAKAADLNDPEISMGEFKRLFRGALKS